MENNITFFLTGDSQYWQDFTEWGQKNGGNRVPLIANTINEMNRLPGQDAPGGFSTEKIESPRGVLVAGDLTQCGTGPKSWRDQLSRFDEAWGLTGKEGDLKYPVFEGYGNHDHDPVEDSAEGCSNGLEKLEVLEYIRDRNKDRLIYDRNGKILRTGVTVDSFEGIHYSWDWDGVHFINTNSHTGGIHPETGQLVPGKRNYQAHNSLGFLYEDLKRIGTSKPVIIMQHYAFDRFSRECRKGTGDGEWWSIAEEEAMYDVIKNYNVRLILAGHTHAYCRKKWHGIQSINTDAACVGNHRQGFLAVNIAEGKITVARRYCRKVNASDPRNWKWGRVVTAPLYGDGKKTGAPSTEDRVADKT